MTCSTSRHLTPITLTTPGAPETAIVYRTALSEREAVQSTKLSVVTERLTSTWEEKLRAGSCAGFDAPPLASPALFSAPRPPPGLLKLSLFHGRR